jgi:predicted MPP superfamily phosphohydrolase
MVMTNTYRVPVPRLPPAFSGFRIVHLTDLHLGPLVSLNFINGVIERANRIRRDATVCTGDYVHERDGRKTVDAVWPVLSKLSAPSGVFSVLGNHDHWADSNYSKERLAKSGQDLRHKTVAIERDGRRLWLAGAGDLWEDHVGLDDLLGEVPESDCRIVLAHNPDTADTDFTSRVDLVISGHTHGGQVNIPFVGTPMLPVRNKNYSSGFVKSLRDIGVFISKGVGWTIYPVRFNCAPEIAVLELVPAQEES